MHKVVYIGLVFDVDLFESVQGIFKTKNIYAYHFRSAFHLSAAHIMLGKVLQGL